MELFRARHHSSVVAVCASAIEQEHQGDHVPLRLLLAHSLMALRRNEEAHKQLSICLRKQPRCADAYRLLGHIALLKDQLDSSRIFLRTAKRIDPLDARSTELLDIVERLMQPTVAVEKLPAATATVGSFSR